LAAEDGEIGYGKPPKKSRFAKGRSGNPKGRPKGSRSLAAILAQAGYDRVTVTSNGQTKTLSRIEAMAIQMANKAAAGDPKAVHLFLYWLTKTSDAEAAIHPGSESPDENDAKMMAQLLKRLRQTNGVPPVPDTE
jgi:Family of unknown function (DUF5681)